jgi:hypothetical protein
MQVRLDLYGDGDAHGTHVSIFFIILNGDFDPILEWPFNFPVTFCLFDQTGQNLHVIDSLYPDTTSASFQRPHIVGGIPKFLSLQFLKRHEKYYFPDDKMYIKIEVNFLGIPRSILPYTLSLNPGLPTHVQDAMRDKIIEEQKEIRAKLIAHIHAEDQKLADSSLIPIHPPVPAGIPQQPPSSSTTCLESITCEDISY